MSRDASDVLMRFDANKLDMQTETLRTITEAEGVRVYVTKHTSRPALCVQTALKHETYTSSFDVAESEIADTPSAVKLVTERVKKDAVYMRFCNVVDLVDRDFGITDKAKRAAFIEALCESLDNETRENLAIELMQRVERVPR